MRHCCDHRYVTYEDVETVRPDLTVVGGGIAGTCAAVAAAREGLDVALVNDRPVLGGSSSSEIRVSMCGATKIGHRSNRNRFAREGGLVEELTLRSHYRNREGNPHLWDSTLQDFVNAEDTLSLFLNTLAVDVETQDSAITSILAHQDRSERTFRFESPYFVDATGDGTLAVAAGAEWTQGSESRAEYGESMAPETAGDETMGSTIMFTAKDAGAPVTYDPPEFAHDFKTETPNLIEQYLDGFTAGHPYAWWLEYGGRSDVDTLADNEVVRDELWAIVYGIWDYVKNSGEFEGVETLTLEWVGKIPGKRESRRVVGEYVTTQDDLVGSPRLEDAVGHGGWHIDVHPPKGIYDEEGADTAGTTEADRVHHFFDGPYSYPYRSLYAPEVENLLLAGRHLSASRLAFASLRVQMTLGTVGQAAGTAAALCVRHDATPRGVYENHLSELRQTLLREDQWIIDAENADPDDLARDATVRASSTCPPTLEAATERVALDAAVGLHVPVGAGTESVELLVEAAERGSTLTVTVWREARQETYVPEAQVGEHRYELKTEGDGPQWIEVPLPDPGEGAGAFVVLEATDGVVLHASEESRTGVLASIEDRDVAPDDSPWPLVDWTPCFRLTGDAQIYGPANVLDGVSRPYGAPRCWASAPFEDAPGDAKTGVNEARPADPPWLELSWPEPRTVSAVQFAFNSNLTPWYNTLDPEDPATVAGDDPGAAVPSVVADYRVERATADGWEPLVEESGNYQRLRRHAFDPVETDRLRVVVEATNGLARAELFEVRAYGPDAAAALGERPVGGS